MEQESGSSFLMLMHGMLGIGSRVSGEDVDEEMVDVIETGVEICSNLIGTGDEDEDGDGLWTKDAPAPDEVVWMSRRRVGPVAVSPGGWCGGSCGWRMCGCGPVETTCGGKEAEVGSAGLRGSSSRIPSRMESRVTWFSGIILDVTMTWPLLYFFS